MCMRVCVCVHVCACACAHACTRFLLLFQHMEYKSDKTIQQVVHPSYTGDKKSLLQNTSAVCHQASNNEKYTIITLHVSIVINLFSHYYNTLSDVIVKSVV